MSSNLLISSLYNIANEDSIRNSKKPLDENEFTKNISNSIFNKLDKMPFRHENPKVEFERALELILNKAGTDSNALGDTTAGVFTLNDGILHDAIYTIQFENILKIDGINIDLAIQNKSLQELRQISDREGTPKLIVDKENKLNFIKNIELMSAKEIDSFFSNSQNMSLEEKNGIYNQVDQMLGKMKISNPGQAKKLREDFEASRDMFEILTNESKITDLYEAIKDNGTFKKIRSSYPVIESEMSLLQKREILMKYASYAEVYSNMDPQSIEYQEREKVKNENPELDDYSIAYMSKLNILKEDYKEIYDELKRLNPNEEVSLENLYLAIADKQLKDVSINAAEILEIESNLDLTPEEKIIIASQKGLQKNNQKFVKEVFFLNDDYKKYGINNIMDIYKNDNKNIHSDEYVEIREELKEKNPITNLYQDPMSKLGSYQHTLIELKHNSKRDISFYHKIKDSDFSRIWDNAQEMDVSIFEKETVNNDIKFQRYEYLESDMEYADIFMDSEKIQSKFLELQKDSNFKKRTNDNYIKDDDVLLKRYEIMKYIAYQEAIKDKTGEFEKYKSINPNIDEYDLAYDYQLLRYRQNDSLSIKQFENQESEYVSLENLYIYNAMKKQGKDSSYIENIINFEKNNEIEFTNEEKDEIQKLNDERIKKKQEEYLKQDKQTVSNNSVDEKEVTNEVVTDTTISKDDAQVPVIIDNSFVGKLKNAFKILTDKSENNSFIDKAKNALNALMGQNENKNINENYEKIEENSNKLNTDAMQEDSSKKTEDKTIDKNANEKITNDKQTENLEKNTDPKYNIFENEKMCADVDKIWNQMKNQTVVPKTSDFMASITVGYTPTANFKKDDVAKSNVSAKETEVSNEK